jgi:hypothetical protein
VKLREDGVRSLVESALRLDLSVPQIQQLLADHGHDWTLETVRKRVREARTG